MGQSVHSEQSAWMGIDLGTQSVRAVVIGDDGALLGSGSAPLSSQRFADGRHEQDPAQWWESLGAASRAALTGLTGVRIGGVSTCGTSGTVLLVANTPDDPAQPRSAALMYDDARAESEALRVQAAPAEVWERNGVSPQRTWALPKAMWLTDRAEDMAGLRLAHQVDVINSRLAGEPVAADTSNALKTGVDPVTAEWPVDDLERLGLNRSLFPRLRRPGELLGTVEAVAAAHTGLPPGTPIIAGMTDGCAAQIAAGVLEPGQWNFVIGTTIVLKGVSERLLRDPSGALYSHHAPDRRWWPGGASSAGAAVLADEYPASDYDELDRIAAQREPAGSVIYPLSGPGERFPFRDTAATRLELGHASDREDRYAAILQGVAYVQRLCLDHVGALGASVGETITITGGATRSRYWPQLQADILGRRVSVPRLAEGAVGMAILAAAGIEAPGADRLAATAARLTGPMTTYHPRPDAAERFAPGYFSLVAALEDRGWISADFAHTILTGGY